MNVEAWSHVADAASFVLVTKEFLGKERVDHFRALVESMLLWMMNSIRGKEDKVSVVTIGSVAGTLVLYSLVIVGIVIIAHYRGAPPHVMGPALFMVTIFILYIILNISYSGILFFVGASLFLLTRAVCFWDKFYGFEEPARRHVSFAAGLFFHTIGVLG